MTTQPLPNTPDAWCAIRAELDTLVAAQQRINHQMMDIAAKLVDTLSHDLGLRREEDAQAVLDWVDIAADDLRKDATAAEHLTFCLTEVADLVSVAVGLHEAYRKANRFEKRTTQRQLQAAQAQLAIAAPMLTEG